MTILCCGDRNWDNWDLIWLELRKFDKGTKLVEGEARGADIMCRCVGEKLGFDIKKHPANWTMFGKAAGPIRNREMLREHPDIELVLAFHNDLNASKGTKDMVQIAKAKGIKVRHISEEGVSET